MTQQPQEPAQASCRPSAAPAGSLRLLALVGAGLALVFYLLGFVSDAGTTGLVGALVIGGGLLAGTAALPRVGRVLAPAAVVAAVGTLGLLQVVVSSRGGGLLLIGALLVALLETAVVVGALLVDAGVVGAAEKRPKRKVDQAATPPAEWSPDQAWLGQHPDPPEAASIQPTGARGAAPSDLTMTYGSPPGGAAQQQYAAPQDNTAMIGAPGSASRALAVGPSGAVPVFDQAAAAPSPATEVVPVYGLSAAGSAERGQASDAPQGKPADAPVPPYGAAGAQAAVNGASVAELGQPSSPYNAAVDGQAHVFGPSQQAGAAGERGQPGQPGQPGQAHGGPGAPAPAYSAAGAPSPGAANGRASGPSHAAPDEGSAPQFRPAGTGTPGQRPPSGPAPGAAPLYGLSASGSQGTSSGGPAGSGPAHAAPTGATPAPAAYGPPATAGSQNLSGTHHAGQNGTGDASLAVRGSVVPGSSGSGSSGSGSPGSSATGSSGSGSSGSPVPGPRAAPSSSGAHHAATGEGYGGQVLAGGARVHRGGPTAAGDAAPAYGRSGSGGPGPSTGGPAGSGSHHAPTPGGRGDAAPSPRAASAPVGREVSGETAIPMYGLPGSSNPGAHSSGTGRAGRGPSDTTSDTTAFRAQPTDTASDATPAFGHAPTEGRDATMVAPPGWLSAANGSGQPPAAPTPESTTPSGRHGSRRKGRHGQPD